MGKNALIVIDIQNDITKHYKDVVENINAAVRWAVSCGMPVGYIKHNNLSEGTRTFKPGTKGAEFAPELEVVSDHIFVKTKSNALTSEPFAAFIRENDLTGFYLTGADAAACVKSTCFNMVKAGYTVCVFSDCVTSYDLEKLPEMFAYYKAKGCEVRKFREWIGERPMIETKRLNLYAASQKQMEAFIAAQSEDALKAAYTEMLNGCLSHPSRWAWYAIWMIERKDGTHVGELCFKGVDASGAAEIGYGIAAAHRGCGYATEAVTAATAWALAQSEVTCVTAEAEGNNLASVKVLRKSGFAPTDSMGEEGMIYKKCAL